MSDVHLLITVSCQSGNGTALKADAFGNEAGVRLPHSPPYGRLTEEDSEHGANVIVV